MNVVSLTGTLQGDSPVVRYTGERRMPTVSFRILVNRGGDKPAMSVPVIVYGKHSGYCAQYMTPDCVVAVTGSLEIETTFCVYGRQIQIIAATATPVAKENSNGYEPE